MDELERHIARGRAATERNLAAQGFDSAKVRRLADAWELTARAQMAYASLTRSILRGLGGLPSSRPTRVLVPRVPSQPMRLAPPHPYKSPLL